jgi:hypothetical protein
MDPVAVRTETRHKGCGNFPHYGTTRFPCILRRPNALEFRGPAVRSVTINFNNKDRGLFLLP